MRSDERGHDSAPRQDDLWETLRTILLGVDQIGARQVLLTGIGLALFGATFVAYELDVFSHSGGVVFIPFHAAIVGVIAAFWTGYCRHGLLTGWGLTYLSLLGWRSEWATDISPRPLIERMAYVVRPDGLLALAVIGIGVAVVGFTAGALVRRGINALRDSPRTTSNT